jgi:ribosomal-protein-alanine N-acetyltransferase
LYTLCQVKADKENGHLADFMPKDFDNKTIYIENYTKLLKNPNVNNQTILLDGLIVGSIGKFVIFGEVKIIYWIDWKYWGMGIATDVLKEFLQIESSRPMTGRVAFYNYDS